MGFWKKHSYQIVRLFVIQIGIAIFGLVLSFAVSAAFREKDDRVPLLMVSIFSVLFYLFILYSVAWEIGGKDRIRLDAVHAPIRGGLGFLLSLLAELPNLVLSLLMVIGGVVCLLGAPDVGKPIFAVGYLPSNYFLSSMYFGIFKTLLAVSGLVQDVSSSYYLVVALLFLASVLPAILVTGFGYWMGHNEKRIIPAKRPDQNA